ncbi:MAG: FKBP-type peptidyl-prolyl cis-trans isomerase [Methanobacteriaceae archaeon]|nr:FKBP-type peptidyl-prolyl cis-trans isomerase [Methanobacteriaceae archaeon]
MAINENEFIKLNYTGSVKETGDIFDTTLAEKAEESGYYDENKVYEPMVLAVGSDQLISALQDEIVGMEIGDKKTVEISSDDAFGPRDPSMLKLIPMKEFKKQGIKPVVGMPISQEGINGVIRTVNGGRITVDFNHFLAGKDIVYDIEVVDVIEDDVDKLKGLLKVYYGNPQMDIEKTKITIDDCVAEIELDKLAGFERRSAQEITLAKFKVAKEAWENIDSIEQVKFIETFEPELVKEEDSEEEVAPEVLKEEE